MTANDVEQAGVRARLSTVRNTLLPSELRIAEIIMAEPEAVVEMTAQQLAERAGVARSTAIRTCQRLGYRGFPQLRVALARDLALLPGPQPQAEGSDLPDGPVLGAIRADINALAHSLGQITAMLEESSLQRAVERIIAAPRLLAMANGLSAPLASDLSMRLTSLGRPTELVADTIAQQIAARSLAAADAAVIISGSGANESSLRAGRAVRDAGATLIVITSFTDSPLVELADVALVVAPAGGSFRHELEHTSRVPHVILLESLVEVIASRLGERAAAARSQVLQILSENLSD